MEDFSYLNYLCWAHDEDEKDVLDAEYWREQS
jgi:hypothetical protein